jgi:hypothetical protein
MEFPRPRIGVLGVGEDVRNVDGGARESRTPGHRAAVEGVRMQLVVRGRLALAVMCD